MSPENKEIHEACLKLCNGYLIREAPIVLQLQKVGETKLYRDLKMKNLFKYVVEICGLSEGAAYSFIAVGKATKLYPDLKEAIVSRALTVSKANRIISILNPENAKELVEFSKTHSARAIEREVRRRNPKASVKAKIKPLTDDTDLLCAPISHETTEHIERAQSLLAQKTSKHQGIPETISLVFEDYVQRHDPVKKAERAQKRKAIYARAEKSKMVIEKKGLYKRIPLTAEQKHIVDLRDQRKCTHLHNGKRCGDAHWIHYHHIISVANGGTNDPSNIATLCSFHHDLVHQLSLPRPILPVDCAQKRHAM